MKTENQQTEEYYSQKIKDFGISPAGVDWNGEESQTLRFEQLCKVFNPEKPGTCADIGCGYGALLPYLQKNNLNSFDYFGYDLSQEMINAAKNAYPTASEKFIKVDDISEMDNADYCIASGIFNVKQDMSDEKWEGFVMKSLNQINEKSSKGFSFNILTSYSDIDKRRDYLYYASPEKYFAYCKENFSRNVALLHDYNLYEFTILVKK